MTEQEQYIIDNSARVLRRLRLDATEKITQEQVATAMKIVSTGYNHLENGTRKLYLLDMIRIAAFYNMKLSDLAALLQQSPAELEKIKQLQLELDEALKQNAWLKMELEKVNKRINNGKPERKIKRHN